MAFFQKKALVFNDQDWATDSSGVGEDAYFSVSDVANNGYFQTNVVHGASAEFFHSFDELVGVSVDPDPAAVDEDFGCVGDGGGVDLLEVLHGPFFEELEDGGGFGADADVCHEGEVFDETDGGALGCLCIDMVA